MKTLYLIKMNQPAGTFFFGKINSQDLIEVYEIGRRRDETGPQRDANLKKIKKIDAYGRTNDRVIFPTPIIVNIKSNDNVTLKELNDDLWILNYSEDSVKFRIIDGQHRLLGVKSSGIPILFPLVVMFDLTPEEEAYVFTILNHNQTKVDKSQIYDLFELSSARTPEKTCHDIARIMNCTESSPFYKKLKMLGKKTSPTETLSQAAFVDGLLPFFNKSTETSIFYSFFSEDKDEVILKVLSNYFSAVKELFPNDWNDTSKILTKTTGYFGLCQALPQIFKKGLEQHTLSFDFFKQYLKDAKAYIDKKNISFDSSNFHTGKQGQAELSNLFLMTSYPPPIDSENSSSKPCKKDHSDIASILNSLTYGQYGSGRHKCAGCAYEQGFKDGLYRIENVNIEQRMQTLDESQAGVQRHKSAQEAYVLGYQNGLAESKKESSQES